MRVRCHEPVRAGPDLKGFCILLRGDEAGQVVSPAFFKVVEFAGLESVGDESGNYRRFACRKHFRMPSKVDLRVAYLRSGNCLAEFTGHGFGGIPGLGTCSFKGSDHHDLRPGLRFNDRLHPPDAVGNVQGCCPEFQYSHLVSSSFYN